MVERGDPLRTKALPGGTAGIGREFRLRVQYQARPLNPKRIFTCRRDDGLFGLAQPISPGISRCTGVYPNEQRRVSGVLEIVTQRS